MANPSGRRPPAGRPLTVESLEARDVPAFGASGGGLSIAIGNVVENGSDPANGIPAREYVLATGPGVEGHIRIYDPGTGGLLRDLDPFPGFTGGLNVATGDVNNDGYDEIIVAPASGGGPVVKVLNADGSVLKLFLAY